MILSHNDLKRAWKRKQIRFSPDISESQVAESSIDLRLGYHFTMLKPQSKPVRPAAEGFDPGPLTKRKSYENEADPVFRLRPREFVLGFTREEIAVPGWLAANVQGKSSLARAGLAVHITAPHINPGFIARITLEMYNHGPWNLELIPGKDLICQVIFYKLTSPVPRKVIEAFGTYKKQSTPFPARRIGASSRVRSGRKWGREAFLDAGEATFGGKPRKSFFGAARGIGPFTRDDEMTDHD